MDATPSIHPIAGVRLGVAAAGIKRTDRDDLLLIELAAGATASGVFTRNAFCAAPVTVARRHLAGGMARYLLVNSGNANAGTGAVGLEDALRCCRAVAAHGDCETAEVLPFSTGVIGQDLPVGRIERALPQAFAALAADGWEPAARAIMTTDTVPKLASVEVAIDGRPVRVTGIAKGAGMIHPDMATMLAFVATDAAVAPALLEQTLARAVAPSFNSISIDGDTSTNDACMLLASGASGVTIGDADSLPGRAFQQAVDAVCMALARAIVKDGEGATKLVEIRVEGARDRDEARRVGFTVAHSPLVKTALFASDPNWGRILAAVGRAGIDDLDLQRVRIWLDEVSIVRAGGRDPGYTEAAGQAVMARAEIPIRIALGRGGGTATILTCDFSYDYVRINAEYRT